VLKGKFRTVIGWDCSIAGDGVVLAHRGAGEAEP